MCEVRIRGIEITGNRVPTVVKIANAFARYYNYKLQNTLSYELIGEWNISVFVVFCVFTD